MRRNQIEHLRKQKSFQQGSARIRRGLKRRGLWSLMRSVLRHLLR